MFLLRLISVVEHTLQITRQTSLSCNVICCCMIALGFLNGGRKLSCDKMSIHTASSGLRFSYCPSIRLEVYAPSVYILHRCVHFSMNVLTFTRPAEPPATSDQVDCVCRSGLILYPLESTGDGSPFRLLGVYDWPPVELVSIVLACR